jgi:hypothetical protein
MFPQVAKRPITWANSGSIYQAANHKATVDLKTGKVFAVVSGDYRLIWHQEAIDLVEKTLAESNGLGDYAAHTRFFNDGGRMKRTYRFPDVSIDIQLEDPANPCYPPL